MNIKLLLKSFFIAFSMFTGAAIIIFLMRVFNPAIIFAIVMFFAFVAFIYILFAAD